MATFDSSLGGFLIGTVLAIWLCGIVSVQSFFYYTTFPKDRKDHKTYTILVAVLLAFTYAHTIILIHTVYWWMVTNWGVFFALLRIPASTAVEPLNTAIVGSIVQVFYARRVYVVSNRSPYFPIAILTCSAIQFGFGLGNTIKIFVFDRQISRFPEWKWGLSVWLISASVADLFITGSLVYYLRKARGEFQRTNSLLVRLTRNTIETNGLTAVAAVLSAILFLVYPTSSWYVMFQFPLVSLYFMAVLVSLNSRQKISTQLSTASGQSAFTATPGEGSHGSQVSGVKPRSEPIIPIRVSMNTTTTQRETFESEKEIGSTSSDTPASSREEPEDEVELSTFGGRRTHPFA